MIHIPALTEAHQMVSTDTLVSQDRSKGGNKITIEDTDSDYTKQVKGRCNFLQIQAKSIENASEVLGKVRKISKKM